MKKFLLSFVIVNILVLFLVSCKKTYTIRYLDYDDTLIKEEKVEDISSINKPTPKREGYVFLGFDDDLVENKDIETKARYTKEEEKEIDTTLFTCMDLPNRNKSIKQLYKKSLLLKDSREFDMDLAKLSFALSYSNYSVSKATDFFNELGFDNLYFNDFDNNSASSVKFVLAHKKLDDTNLISISSPGYDYNSEWANNFTIGDEGNHFGYTICVTNMIDKIIRYIASSYSDSNIRLWITGYSRGGGISNLLADTIMKEKYFGLKQSEIYTYTFEAPAPIIEENYVEYKNVFNIINSYDLVPNILNKYNFKRCGIDIDIYNDNYQNWLKKMDSNFPLGSFTVSNNYKNFKQFGNALFNCLYQKTANYSLQTRKDYYNKFEKSLSYLLENLCYDMSEFISYVPEYFRGVMDSVEDDYTKLLDVDKIYSIIKDICDHVGSSYDEKKLYDSTEVLYGVLQERSLNFAISILPSISNLSLAFELHSIETIYLMLQNYSI